MTNNFITRDEAINVLSDIIDANILDEELQNSLEEIRLCIEDECKGYHSWGAESDFSELFTAYREDLWTDELKAKIQGIHDKYSFTPAPYEAEDFENDEDEEEE